MVFLCYSHTDTQRVTRLASLMKNAGVDIWFDRFSIPPGVSLGEIYENIARCDSLLVCETHAFMSKLEKSPRIKELEFAYRLMANDPTFKVIHVQLDDVAWERMLFRLPINFNNLSYYNLTWLDLTGFAESAEDQSNFNLFLRQTRLIE